MNARINAGFLKGRVIRIPEKKLSFRPTLERARVSIADILQPRLAGSICADICAGSGSIGFEMLSRGAARVDFVENDSNCAEVIRAHADQFKVADRCTVISMDVRRFADSYRDRYDIVFLDPPYHDETLNGIHTPLLRLVRSGGILLYQRHRRAAPKTPVEPEGAVPFDTRRYGNSIVELYRP